MDEWSQTDIALDLVGGEVDGSFMEFVLRYISVSPFLFMSCLIPVLTVFLR